MLHKVTNKVINPTVDNINDAITALPLVAERNLNIYRKTHVFL